MKTSYYQNKNVLVTGGAGLIGTNLCEALLQVGANVYSIDNYFAGRRDNLVNGVVYIEGHTKDISNLVDSSINKDIKLDLVFHLGEYARVAESINEPSIVWDLNFTGTTAVLDYCKDHKVRLIYAGSSTKFAADREDGVHGRDLSPYTFAKYMMSELVARYGEWYGLDYSISYFYNVYGKYERADKYGTVIELFKNKYLKDEPLTVRLPGTQKRSYTSVLDTVSALFLIGEKGAAQGYHITADQAYSIDEVAKMYAGAELVYLPARLTSRPSGIGDNTSLKNLGWSQHSDLKDYIQEIVNIKNNTN
jgi:UDP-glucose 4-epimerase